MREREKERERNRGGFGSSEGGETIFSNNELQREQLCADSCYLHHRKAQPCRVLLRKFKRLPVCAKVDVVLSVLRNV